MESLSTDWIVLVRSYFLVGGLLILVAHRSSRWLRPLLVYGKTQQSQRQGQSPPGTSSNEASIGGVYSFIDYLSVYTVPRSYFKHFYVFSTALGVLLLSISHGQGRPRNVAGLLLLTHSTRRLLETSFIERPSGSRMWFGHYLIGMTFYLCANLATLDNSSVLEKEGAYRIRPSQLPIVWHSVAVFTFFMAQMGQHMTHRQLASIRQSCRPGQYINPTDGLFRFCIAPHYTAEVIMYCSLAFVQPGNLSLWLMALWTTVILLTSALQTDRWGRSKFRDWGRRWIIIPGIY